MRLRIFAAVACAAMFAGFAAEAATFYICKEVPAKDPDHSTLAVLAVGDDGTAAALDGWSANTNAGGSKENWAEAKIRRNDAKALYAGWTTSRLRSNISTYHKLDFTLQINKKDMSFYLGLSSSEIRGESFRGICVKKQVKG